MTGKILYAKLVGKTLAFRKENLSQYLDDNKKTGAAADYCQVMT